MATTYTIQKSSAGYFTVLPPGATVASKYPMNSYDFVPNTDGTFSIVNIYNGNSVIPRELPSNVINGDTSVAFADLAAVSTYVSNFFRSAGGSSGVSNIPSGLMGYATLTTGTTGGAGGSVVYVSTLDALKTAAAGNTATIIYITGSISGAGDDAVGIGSNKTFKAVPGVVLTGISLRAFGPSNNLIFQNLTMQHAQTDNTIIIKTGAHHVWIDHCDFYADKTTHNGSNWDYFGKAIAVTDSSDYVTISWCRFHDSFLSVLIGADPADSTLNYQHVTMHHNWYYNDSEREPAIWSSNVHCFNNYHIGNTGYSIGSRASANVRTDNEYFDGCLKPASTNFSGDPAGYFSGLSTNTYVNCGANDVTTSDNGWLPSYDYSSYLDTAANVPAIVKAYSGVPSTPVTPIVPTFMKSNELLGAIQEFGGAIKAMPVGVPLSSFTANRVLVNGRIEFVSVYIKEACTLTGVQTVLQTAGAYTGTVFNGAMFYKQHFGTRTLLGTSSGGATTWQATANTLLKMPFTVGIPVTPGLYSVALMYNNSAQTTAPKIYCSVDYNQTIWNIFELTNSDRVWGAKTSATADPTTILSTDVISIADAPPLIMVY